LKSGKCLIQSDKGRREESQKRGCNPGYSTGVKEDEGEEVEI